MRRGLKPTGRIAVTGPESTGKSWLSAALARHYNTLHVPEYAREYIGSLSRDYRRDDLYRIASGQLRREKDLLSGASAFLFCDTELIVIKIWSLHKYGECHPWILEQIEKQPCDLYLLCDVDLPWEEDPQREHPQLRSYFFRWFRRELEDYGFSYCIVSGRGEERLRNAIRCTDEFFKNP